MFMTVDIVLECGTEIIEALVYHVPEGWCFNPYELDAIDSLAELETVIRYGGLLGFNIGTVYGLLEIQHIVSFSAHVDLQVASCDCTTCSCAEQV